MASMDSTLPERKKKPQEAEQELVLDCSVDYKGEFPRELLQAAGRHLFFIIGIEFAERLSYFGLATNLIIYLTEVLHQDLETAAKNVNYWSGVTTMMPLVGGFVADAYLGRFSTVLLSSSIYIVGLLMLTMTQLIPSLKPCELASCRRSLRLHEIIFFLSMYLISVGTGGHKPALESFGADQFDDNDATERRKKMSYFNWWNFALCSGLILGVTVIVYVEDNVSWWLAYVLLTAVMAISIMIFVAGRPIYRYRAPEGSPFTPMLHVIAAAMAKRRLALPLDAGELYEIPKTEQTDKRLLYHTNKLRCLDKAAIVEHKGDEVAFAMEKLNQWRLATVTQIEELKLILSVLPIWLAGLPFGICVAQANTFFIKQGTITDRRLGHFTIPAASVYSLGAIGMLVSVTFYDKILIPFLRRATGDERGITILKRIGIGMAISATALATAALVERRRLRLVAEGQTMSMSWLLPQFMILGIGDGFALVGLQEYFYDQVPDCMRSLGIAFYLSVLGVANFMSSFLITIVDHATSKRPTGSWFAKDLNHSRLDLYYWLVAGISSVNLCGYVYLAKRYTYKRVQNNIRVVDSPEIDA